MNTCPMEFGGQMAVLVVARDITERMRLEAQLRQVQKMQAIGTLAGGIAHDFNNILAAILGYTELALYYVPHGSRMQRHLEEVLTAGKRARDLVQQILAFSRQRSPERQPVRLHLLISDVLRMLRASLPSTIAIHPRLPSTAGAVLADPTQLQQVLMNLCTNAEHAMRDTGGVLAVHLNVVEVTARKGKRALAEGFVDRLAAKGYSLVLLSDEAWREDPRLYKDLGFARVETIVFFEKDLGRGQGPGVRDQGRRQTPVRDPGPLIPGLRYSLLTLADLDLLERLDHALRGAQRLSPGVVLVRVHDLVTRVDESRHVAGELL